MNMKKSFRLIIAGVLFFNVVAAQDPSFSQFFASPLTLNPALTGKFNGDLRAAGNYRNQWPDVNRAYITSTVSVDLPILQGFLPEDDQGAFFVVVQTPGGASLERTTNVIEKAEAILREDEAVADVTSVIGLNSVLYCNRK